MTILKRFSTPLLATCFAIALAACNNSADTAKAAADITKMDTTKMDTAKAAPAPVAAPALAAPFDVAEANETLKDFAAWKPAFDSGEANRKAAGLEKIALSQVMDKPNSIQIVLKVADVQKAKDFYTSPKMKEVMQKAGVIAKSQFNFFHVIRFNADSKEKQWVEVTHKVKNFDAWVKVYDAEGAEKRKSEGMVEVAMARGMGADSNNVQLVFDITDMAKAKAAIASAGKKKLMTSAGVMGMPKIVYYKSVD